MKEPRKNKLAQEEMIGFVLIILLVSIIALVFFSLSIKRQPETKTSKEVESFLYSSLIYTTDCKASEERFYNFEDLIPACYQNSKCLDGRDTCQVLNETASILIERSFDFNFHYKAYSFRVYSDNSSLLDISLNNKISFPTVVASVPIASPYLTEENLKIELKLYY